TLEDLTGRPVLGVLPWQRDLWLDSEDSLALTAREADAAAALALRVAVVMLPRISNFTDVDALCLEPDLRVDFVTDPRPLASADVVVLPGTRATLADLEWLRSRGLDTAITGHARRGGTVLGLCGGCQMLGRTIRDPDGVEGSAGRPPPGLGLRDGSVYGTMWHGSLEHDAFRGAWLAAAAEHAGRDGGRFGRVSFAAAREARLDLLADLVEEHLDMDAVLRLIAEGPPVLPTVR